MRDENAEHELHKSGISQPQRKRGLCTQRGGLLCRPAGPNHQDTLGRIVVKVRILEGNVLEISVRDWGRGIADVDQARQPLFTTGGEERSGMGFTIMESFMDELTVRSDQGKGTRVTMRRRIKPRRAGL